MTNATPLRREHAASSDLQERKILPMATALKVLPEPTPQPACEHVAFNPYEKDGDVYDDTMTTLGHCLDCDQWLSLWTRNTTGEILAERELVSGEIRRLRERYDHV